MKFKKYLKESTSADSKILLKEGFFDMDDWNPDRPSYVQDEIDRVFGPIRKLIDAGRYDEAREELQTLRAEVEDMQATNAKKRFFKWPKFMIQGQLDRINALEAKIPTASNNESVQDMNKRCEKCNTLLNDSGTCPKCDDGEEDYGDELKEELSNKEKLKLAYPELNFDTIISEDFVSAEISNKEKLMKAFPGVFNFDNTLTEGTGSDTAHAIRDTMSNLAKGDKNKWAGKTAEILDAVPDSFMDDLFENIKEKFSELKLNHEQKKKIVDAAGDNVSEEQIEEKDTLGSILDAIDITVWAKKNPKMFKNILLVILGIIAVIEPTPIVEIITGLIALLPEEIVAKIGSIVGVVSNPAGAAVAAANKAYKKHKEKTNEDFSVREKLKAAYPELNFDDYISENFVDTTDNSVDEFLDYDDDYDMDDVELDRRHAALYGGDRMYCDCGNKLQFTEWGGYCPDCEPETAEEEYLRLMDEDIDNEFLVASANKDIRSRRNVTESVNFDDRFKNNIKKLIGLYAEDVIQYTPHKGRGVEITFTVNKQIPDLEKGHDEAVEILKKNNIPVESELYFELKKQSRIMIDEKYFNPDTING